LNLQHVSYFLHTNNVPIENCKTTTNSETKAIMSSSKQIPWVGIAASTASVAASYWIYQTASEYGWDGALRYVWEGDPYTPAIREYLETLENAEKSRIAQEIRINAIEEALERARLDSVDDSARTTKEIVNVWILNYLPQNLERSLAEVSYLLDQLAAKVDGILLSTGEENVSSHVMQDMKRRKRLLSKQLVLDMERCDALVASYQVLQEK